MAPKKMDQDGLVQKSAIGGDDVEGHSGHLRTAPDGAKPQRRSATDESDVEGHKGHVKSAPAGATSKQRSAIDDADVEGHNFGLMNPILARDLAQSKNRDIERSASRNNLVSEAKRGTTRKP